MTCLSNTDIQTREVLGWEGLHLFHYPMSSCSQKLRIYLALKQLQWQPHLINLAAHENHTPWFMGINPRGLLPALVLDGEVHIESNDIIRHLERLYPTPRLIPPPHAGEIDTMLALEDDLHLALRTLSFRFVYGRSGSSKSDAVLESMRSGGLDAERDQPDPKMLKEIEFYERLGREGLSDDMCQSAFEKFRQAFEDFERRLAANAFSLGDAITVIDIAWFVYAFRLELGGYPLERLHPRVFEWFERLRREDAFVREVTPPPDVAKAIAQSSTDQRAAGRSFEQVIRL